MNDYHLAQYLYGFAYFLEILLEENFVAAYLVSITEKINTLGFQDRELYSAAYTQIERRTKSSLQACVLTGLSFANQAAGEAIANIPVISKSQLDENLVEAGRKIGAFEEKRAESTMRQLGDRQSSCVRPFIDQISTINPVFNRPMILVFNNKTLYWGK